MRFVIVVALVLAFSQPASALTCNELQGERDKAAAGNELSQAFMNGWMSGVMNMSAMHVIAQHTGKRQMDYCLDVEKYMHASYMSYDELMKIYDKTLERPDLKVYLQDHPDQCYAEAIALYALADRFPCH